MCRRRQEGPGAVRHRGLSSPVSTRSPELSGSFPSDLFPRAVRLPQKVSLGSGDHSLRGSLERGVLPGTQAFFEYEFDSLRVTRVQHRVR